MSLYVLKNKTDAVLFESRCSSLKKCVETAISQGVALDGLVLPRANLAGANLDGIQMYDADLRGANLSGANLSESQLDGTNFSGTALYNACLCESSIRNADFRNASFGATDIAGTDLSGSIFSTLSAFLLNFTDCAAMTGCVFEDPAGISCPMSHPPVVILGLPRPVVLLDRHIKTGAHAPLTYPQWKDKAASTSPATLSPLPSNGKAAPEDSPPETACQ